MFVELSETIFDYNPNLYEMDVLDVNCNELSYISNLSPVKRLWDLQLLFIMRDDKKNRSRISHEMLDILDSLPENILYS